MTNTQEARADFFEVGDKTSLICADAETVDIIKITLRELGFKFHIAETTDQSIERIRYTSYDCIIVHENFAGNSLKLNPVLNYLAPLPMAQRRNSFVCVVGPSFKTLDAMQAFSQSVHLVIHPSDLPNLSAILKKGFAEFDTLYRCYNNVLNSMGE
jgi:hypothetical protein